jgi:AcrR family transcriptional regulator
MRSGASPAQLSGPPRIGYGARPTGEETDSGMATTRTRAIAATSKGNERVGEILEAAKTILVEDGFSALSFREVARRTEMTVGNVGYYFPSKDDLLTALAEHIFDRWDARFRRHVPAEVVGAKAIFSHSIWYMIEENKRPKTKSLLLEMWSLANRSRATMRMMDAFYRRMRQWLEAMLADLDPGAPPNTRRLRAALITAQIEGLMLLVGPNSPSAAELVGLEAEAVRQIERLALGS